jgi:hypothetical protein
MLILYLNRWTQLNVDLDVDFMHLDLHLSLVNSMLICALYNIGLRSGVGVTSFVNSMLISTLYNRVIQLRSGRVWSIQC